MSSFYILVHNFIIWMNIIFTCFTEFFIDVIIMHVFQLNVYSVSHHLSTKSMAALSIQVWKRIQNIETSGNYNLINLYQLYNVVHKSHFILNIFTTYKTNEGM